MPDASAPDAAPAQRFLTKSVAIATNGVSGILEIVVPPETRSFTIVATGDPTKLYALASLRTGDGVERVNIDVDANHGAEMESAYNVEQVGQMPGDLFQSIRLGTFTHVYPHAPGQTATAGTVQLRIASNATAGDVNVTVLMPKDDESKVLHVNLIAVSDTFTIASPAPAFAAWQAIYDQAGITLVVDEVLTMKGTMFNQIMQFTEPQESPQSLSAQLATLGAKRVVSDALNVFMVDALPQGVAGLSLGTPGPPIRSSYYYGVIVQHSTNAATEGRVIAHEVAHFLALQHVTNAGVSGMIYPDPLPDTQPGQGNLMETGTALTQGQIFALSRSALLMPK